VSSLLARKAEIIAALLMLMEIREELGKEMVGTRRLELLTSTVSR
jgi:hypothetical protein